jgi:hypothetical protein
VEQISEIGCNVAREVPDVTARTVHRYRVRVVGVGRLGDEGHVAGEAILNGVKLAGRPKRTDRVLPERLPMDGEMRTTRKLAQPCRRGRVRRRGGSGTISPKKAAKEAHYARP